MIVEVHDDATAADAQHWLARNDDNRPLSNLRVEQITQAMLRGEWRHSPDMIAIEGSKTTGQLRNGQHRCHALIRADERQPGITVPLAMAYDLGPDSTLIMDIGKSRDVKDQLFILGEGEARPQYLAGALTLAWHVHAGTYTARQPTPTRVQLFDFLKNDAPDLRDVITLGMTVSRGAHIPASGVTVALWLATRGAHVDRVEQFAHELAHGENLRTDDVTYRLRDRFASWAIQKHSDRMRPWKVCAMTVRCWNAYLTGENLTVPMVRLTGIPDAL